jgi:hypothetical protein
MHNALQGSAFSFPAAGGECGYRRRVRRLRAGMNYLAEKLEHQGLRRGIELAVGPVLLILVWWIAFEGQLVNKDLLPSPFDTLRDTALMIRSGKMTADFTHTLLRVV